MTKFSLFKLDLQYIKAMIPIVNTIKNSTNYLIPKKHKSEIYANTRFGIPSQSCAGLGICSLELLSSIHDKPAIACSCDNGRVTIKVLDSDRLCFQFLKSDLSPESQAKHFNDKVFVIQEDFVLPNSFTRILGFNKTLRVGVYPVIEEKQHYKVFL